MRSPDASLFRDEALEHRRAQRSEGSVLRIAPSWTRWTYAIVVSLVLASVAFSAIARIHEYASGPAIVRVDGRTELTAHAQDTVAEVLVEPGQRVRRNDVLVRFYMAHEEAERDSVQREYDALLLKVLRDPADDAARQGLTSLSAQRELAQRRIAARSIVAPHDGTVSDVRIRAGQAVKPGDGLLTLAANESRCSVIAMLPAHYRPMLHEGMELRLELAGFPHAYRRLKVERLSDEAVGPSEVKRYLGNDLADTVAVQGPVVLVHASMPTSTFDVDGQTYRYYDGMPAKADARVRIQSVLVTLIPGLDGILRGTRE